MHIKKNYTALEMAWWTRFETLLFIAIIIVWIAAYYFFDLAWLKIPWTPLALIGTAVAFVIGFQNNSAYGRIWEARNILLRSTISSCGFLCCCYHWPWCRSLHK